MVLLLDGYNIIGHLLPRNRSELLEQRSWLINRVKRYQSIKHSEISMICIVFDGGSARHRQREVHGEVVVLFAGHQWSADDVLVEYSGRYGSQAVVITNDRELTMRCAEHAAQTLRVDDFDVLCSRVLRGYKRSECSSVSGLTKLSDDNDADLDTLMERASMAFCQKDESVGGQDRRRNSAKKKKQERRRVALGRKLG